MGDRGLRSGIFRFRSPCALLEQFYKLSGQRSRTRKGFVTFVF